MKLAAGRGEPVDAAMRRGWPQIHFSRTASFKAQVSRWSEERLADACGLLLETEALTRTTAIPAEAVTGRALFSVAAMQRCADAESPHHSLPRREGRPRRQGRQFR